MNTNDGSKTPNLFDLYPEMIPRLKALTLGGRKIFDDFGNLKDDDQQADEE